MAQQLPSGLVTGGAGFIGSHLANRLRRLGDVNVYVPSGQYGYVEMAHSVIGHCLTDMAIARLALRSDDVRPKPAVETL